MNSISYRTVLYTSALLLAFTLVISRVNAGTWTPPPSTPPNDNVDAPLNVGVSHQNKTGSLSLNTSLTNPDIYGLDVFGISRFFGNLEVGSILKPATIKIIDGNQSDGKVLVSDANGTASWRSISGIQNNTNDPVDIGVYTFDSRYFSLMRNSEFRTWFAAFTNGPSMLKPLTGDGSMMRNDEGWSKVNAQVTADKICNFFTDGPSVRYVIDEDRSTNNNSFYYWDRNTSSWKSYASNWIDSTDIEEVSCLGMSGIKRGAVLIKNDPDSSFNKCTIDKYAISVGRCPTN